MTDCEKYQELLSAMLDGELTEAEQRALEAHLAECPDCRAMYEAFAAVHAAVSETEELPETLHSGIMNRVNAAAGTGKKRGTVRYLRPALTAAACLAVVAGALLTLGKGSPKNAMSRADSVTGGTIMECAEAPESEPNGGYGAEEQKEKALFMTTMMAPAPEEAGRGSSADEAPAATDNSAAVQNEYKAWATDAVELEAAQCVTVRLVALTDDGFTAVVTSEDSQFTVGEKLLVAVDGETEPIPFNLFPGGEYRVDYSDCGQTADGVPEIRAERIGFVP